MAHLQYIPGDPRLVDQLVYELKSKGIFDQFRKDCIADVDTRPAYQNLRQRVENSVSTFLSRQCWKPDLNKNQLREKLRKHILDGNYLEQGVERIVDQVVNPKVASVFIPKVEDLVYNYLGITRKKTTPVAETSNEDVIGNKLLPTDLEAVSPVSVKSNDDKTEAMEISQGGEDSKMELDIEKTKDKTDITSNEIKKEKTDYTRLSVISDLTSNDSLTTLDKNSIPLPNEEIKLENIPAPDNSPPPISTKFKVTLEKIEFPQEPFLSKDIPLPDETPKLEKEIFFKPVNSEDDGSSSDSSLRRNMSPLTPIRNFNNENSCDAQQAFENEDNKVDKKETLEPSTFRFTIESKVTENSSDAVKVENQETEQANLSYQFNNQININTFNTPLYDDSSNSTHLQIDYESDANSKNNVENKVPEPDLNSGDSRKDKKSEEKKTNHRSSRHSDSHKHSSSKDRRSDSKQSSSKDSKSYRKSSKDDHKSSSKSSHKEKSSERDKKDEEKKKDRDSSKHRSSHKSSGTRKDSKSNRSSSSSQRHSSKHTDEKRSSSSSHRDKSERSSDKYSKEKSSKESKSSSSSHRTDKDRKSSSSSKSKSDDKEKQRKDKKETDDHYSASGRGNRTRRSTDRDSNDGSSSSKGSHHPASSKSSENKKESKESTSKSDSISTSRDSTSPSDKDHVTTEINKNESNNKGVIQVKPIIRIENHLETPISSPPRLPFVPDVTLKKPKFAANMQEARKLMKMRKFLDEEQKRMNQEAALLLEFQANVRPSLSQVYSNIPGPELEFACVTSDETEVIIRDNQMHSETIISANVENVEPRNDTISDILTAAQQVENIEGDNEVQNVEVKSLEKQDINIENVPVDFKAIVVESEVDDEVNQQANTATVQIEYIIEADITSCEMDVDTTIDEKNIQIINSNFTDEIDHTEKVSNDDKSMDQSGIIKIEQITVKNENQCDEMPDSDGIEAQLQSLMPDDDDNKLSKYFQVTIITEELSESEEIDKKLDTIDEVGNKKPEIVVQIKEEICTNEPPFEYFAEHEKYNAELERDRFNKFLKLFTERSFSNKIHVINCDSYEESIIKEMSQNFGEFEIVNYYKNGHLKLNTAKNIVRNINVSSEISLPIDNINQRNPKSPSPIFSPVKSECSFELSSDYDAKLEEMVSKTSRKEIMEIILGNFTDETTYDTSEMPIIDYCTESNIELDSDTENTMKRKLCEVESSDNNNRQVLTPNKIRKLSESEQISSTTEESEETSNNNVSNPRRSKNLRRAKRVGLPRPRRSNLLNSPSSDKSVENYEQNTTQPNGRLKPRKVQRYDPSDLYKPKLHYLSRRNNIS